MKTNGARFGRSIPRTARNNTRRDGTKLRLESLEPRSMMAADVAVSVRNGVLLVQGDAGDSSIMIEQGSRPGEIDITPVCGTCTTINHGANTFHARGVVRAEINMGGGDDTVVIGAEVDQLLSAMDDLPTEDLGDASSIALGLDLDANSTDPFSLLDWLAADRPAAEESVESLDPAVATDPVSVAGSLSIRLGDGDDLLFVAANVLGSVSIDGGDGNDIIDVADSHFGSLAVVGDARFTVGGEDSLFVSHTDVRNGLSATMGGGDDSVYVADTSAKFTSINTTSDSTRSSANDDDTVVLAGSWLGRELQVNTGAGDDMAILFSTAAANTSIATARGDDTVIVTDPNMVNLSITTQDGDDYVVAGALTDSLLFPQIANGLVVDTGNGDDIVGIGGSTATLDVGGYSSVTTGAGDDSATIQSLDVLSDSLEIDSGKGDDTVVVSDSHANRWLSVKLDQGDDYLSITCTDSRFASIRGGGGRNTFAVAADNFFASLDQRDMIRRGY